MTAFTQAKSSASPPSTPDEASTAVVGPVVLPTLVMPAELDTALGFTKGKSKRLANRGELPHYKLPDGSIHFDPTEVNKALAAFKRGKVSDPLFDSQSYLTAADVAERLNVKVYQVRRWTASSAIPFIQIEQTTRYDWREIESALAERTGFKTTRPHRLIDVLTLVQAASKLEMTTVALRRLAELGDVPSYRNGAGKDARLFFAFDNLWAGIVKLQNELTFQEFNRKMIGKAASK